LLWEDRTLDPQVRTRVAWWLGRLNPHEIAPGIDSLEILKEALTWERSQRSSDLVADLQYLVTASESALHDAGGTKEENLLRDKIAHIRDPKLKLAAEVAFLADRALEGNFSQEDSKRLAELQATLQLDPISNGDLLTANNLALTLRTLGQIGEYQTIADRMSAVCRERPAYSFCMILLYEKGLTLAKQEDRSRGEQAIAYFSESLHLAQKIRSASGKARAHYGLLLSHRLVGNIEAAIDNGQAATEFFRNSPAKEWAAISYIQLARAYLDKSDLVATKKSLQSAYPYIPQEFSSIKSLYHKLSAEVAERERDPWLALQETKAYWTEETKIRAEDTTKQYVQMRNDQLRKENSWQTEQIVLLKKYRLLAIMTGVLILIICIFFFLFWRQAQQVAYSRQKLKDVLDHLDQGLAIINEKFQIQSGYSPFLDKLFQHMPNALTSLNFIDFMKRHTRGSESAWAMAGEILQSCLGETALTWEFNFSHLPRDVRFEDRDLQLHWQALYDKSGAIDRYLIAIRDVTLIKSLEEQVRRDHEKLAKIDCKMREILSGNPSRIRNFFRDMKSWLERPDQAFVPRSELLRTLHAWKGTSRSLGLMDLSQSIHQIEDSLKDSLEDSG
ncbi:MAG: Hpt domain-containing protein, partial [Oligoflexus sp.]